MKTSKYIVILICVAIVLAIVFLFNTVFIVSKVNITVEEGVGYSAEQIYSAGKIKIGSNIFNINISEIKNNIENAFNGVKVKKIEREFPNKITINVVQRVAVLVFEADINGDTRTVVTDRDFQMNVISLNPIEEYEEYTTVTGIVINRGNDDGFDLEILKKLRKVLIGFEKSGINSSAFSAFIEKIEIEEDKFILSTRSAVADDGGARFYIPQNCLNFDELVSRLYNSYLSLSAAERSSSAVILI